MKTLTIAVATVMRNGLLMPERRKKVVPSERTVRRAIHSHIWKNLTVEDEVDTSELLPGLNEDARQGSQGDLVMCGLEAVEVRALSQLLFLSQCCAYVFQLDLQLGIFNRQRLQAGHRPGSIVVTTLLDQPTWSLKARMMNGGSTCSDCAYITSGSQTIPTVRTRAHTNWMAIGICHAE